jgi:redox-sensitive bicupin YhaK (pirin superfamily)
LRGSVNHEDSTGHKGVINTGDSQWLTAGSGVLHCDTPVMDGSNKVRALQLWINLEKKNKMVKPKYQLIEENQFKKSSNGVHVKVIAGQSMGNHIKYIIKSLV